MEGRVKRVEGRVKESAGKCEKKIGGGAGGERGVEGEEK